MIAGCAVGPNYKRPVVDSPSAFRDDNSPTNISFADLDWWQVYRDDTLQALVREAFTNNYDLRIAVTRVEQARAVAMQARAQFVPNVEYNGAVSRGRNDLFGSAFPNNAETASSATATLNTFWEVDLWGRVRRLNESARAQFLASEEARRGVRLSPVERGGHGLLPLAGDGSGVGDRPAHDQFVWRELENLHAAARRRHRDGPGSIPRRSRLGGRGLCDAVRPGTDFPDGK